jgi:hypothetical protein
VTQPRLSSDFGRLKLQGRFELDRGDFFFESIEVRAPRDLEFRSEAEAQTTRMYDTIFGRAPDKGGIDFWVGALNQGYSLDAVADFFMTAPEWRNTNGPRF